MGNNCKGKKVIAQDIDGLIVENKDGTISMDFSYNTILNNLKEKNLRNIAEELFK